MRPARLLLVALLLGVVCLVECQTQQSHFDYLRRELLSTRSYDRGSPPFVSSGLEVEFELVLTTLIEVSTAQEFIEFESWWRLYWTDPRLSWDPDHYGGITQMVLSQNELWTPDVTYFEKVSDVASFYGAQVSSSGDVLWSTPHITKIGCPMNIKAFPYDTQTCNFTIGSWTYNGVQLDLAPRKRDISAQVPPGVDVPARSGLDLQQYTQVEPWTLEIARILWKNVFYGCCPEPYPVLIYEFQLERASGTHFSGVITPMLLVSFIGFCIFLIPAPLSGARPALSTTMLLTYVTVYFVASRSTPQSNKTTSIGRMYVVGIVFASMQVILSIISTGLNLIQPDAGKGVEKWMAVFSKFDKDKDGELNRTELSILCRSLGLGVEDKREVLAMLDEHEDGAITAEQWRALGELTHKTDDRATYHNRIVQTLVQASLRQQLRSHKPSKLSQLLDAEPSPAQAHQNHTPNELNGTTHPRDPKPYTLHPMTMYESFAPYPLGMVPGATGSAGAMPQFVHGQGFGQPQAEADAISALDLENRQRALRGQGRAGSGGLKRLAERVEGFTAVAATAARTGRGLAAQLDSWALWVMLPAYVAYLVAEFCGAWSGSVVKAYEVGLGVAPVNDKVRMEFYDYRSGGEFRCYKYTPNFNSTLGLMQQARNDCQDLRP